MISVRTGTTSETEINKPILQSEGRPGQIAPGAHAPAASPARLLGRQQFIAAPSPSGHQIFCLKIHFRRFLLGCVRWRRSRRDRCRGVKFRQGLVVPCSGAHIEQGHRRSCAGTTKRVPRLTIMKQGEDLTARRLVLLIPLLFLRCRQLHFEIIAGRVRFTGDVRPHRSFEHIAVNLLQSLSRIVIIGRPDTMNKSEEIHNWSITQRKSWRISNKHLEKMILH